MDTSERTRLRALYEGIALPWEAMEDYDATEDDEDDEEGPAHMVVLCPHGDTDDRDTVATIDMGHGIECDGAHAALIVGAVNAMPGLLDRVEAAEKRVRELEAIIAGRTTPPTRAEFDALAAATQRAELAEARDRLAKTLAAEDPAARATADAEGTRAMRAAALATARREGAEEMRTAVNAELSRYRDERASGIRSRPRGYTIQQSVKDLAAMGAIDAACARVCALPLPGDDGGES